MKCENCGKNEVSFVYQSNLNGKVEEKHLCAECAEKLGYTQKLAAQSQRMMQGFQSFFDDGFFGGGLLENFFRPALSGGTGRFFGEDLLDGFFDQMPALGAGETENAQQHQPEETELPISETEQSRFARARRLNQLRLELKRAVHQERFEDAAKLRDELHALEAEKK
jgi:protein arginine kinase activator